MNESNRRIARSILLGKCVQVKHWGFLINTLPRFNKNKVHISTLCISAPGRHQSSITSSSVIELEMVTDLFSIQFSMYSLPIYHNKLLKVIN